MKPKKVVFHTDIVISDEKFNVAIHEDSEAGWVMNVRPDKPSEEAETIAMRFWKAVGGDGWKTITEAKGAVIDGLKKTKALEWNKWERETYD